MPIYQLDEHLWFPKPEEYDDSGIIAIGGDLLKDRLLLAYENGIFPWYNEDEPILWWSPIDRMVLRPHEVKISKSLKAILRQEKFKITFNKDFEGVIDNCQNTPRKGQDGTWINNELKTVYLSLHDLGFAHSVECWLDNELVGGLYGVQVHSHLFCGESMFTKVSNASKVAFVSLCQAKEKEGVKWLDCQVYNDHLATLGAYEISREHFLKILKEH